mmetsp:Transcript_130789/g.419460  ORF Transcript_130789/g.419460 Transcript_130789/m.419460 type:complete len:545 (-) Transcript_130789:204-1838(-)
MKLGMRHASNSVGAACWHSPSRVALACLLAACGAEGLSADPQWSKTIHTIPNLDPGTDYKEYMKDVADGVTKKEYDELEDKYERLEREYANLRKAKKDATGGEEKREESKEENGAPVGAKETVDAKEKEGGGVKGAKAKEGGEEESEKSDEQEHAGHVLSVGMFGTVVTLAVSFGMASSKAVGGVVSDYTWVCLDRVVAIFLAVMWFQGFDELLDYSALGPTHKTLISFAHAFALLAVAIFVSWKLRQNAILISVWCGCGAHYVAFASLHASTSTQEAYSSSHGGAAKILVVLTVIYTLIAVAMHYLKKCAGLTEDDEWMEKVNDVENDFLALGLSAVWVQFVRMLCLGAFHPWEGEEEHPKHTESQRACMLAYAIAAIPIGAWVLVKVAKIKQATDSYWAKRLLMFLTAFFAMNVAWSFLLWGQWEFTEHIFHGEALFAKVIFSNVVSCCCMLGIIGLAHLKAKMGFEVMGNEFRVALTALALLIGVAWEDCFDCAVEHLAQGQHDEATFKVGLALALAVVIVPVYAWYLKPKAMEAQERMES